ncbi:DUF998 domain-containing protein [Arthrobacter sp. E3]|uniref:DUF998 domain-containing protein n=1 Tax=Arthrobacter sp. E3 TaxID=517402 RepID=UPI001A941F99|nr:DUF998 domain-containing protein [Arthrobacter sp. E3]
MPENNRSRGQGRVNAQLFWGVVGVLSQLVFTCGWLITQTWQGPAYSTIKNSISDMQAATAPHAWFPIACFAAGALGTFGFVLFGLRPSLKAADKEGAHAPWMVGIGVLLLGNSFPQIPCRLSDTGCTATTQLLGPGGLADAILATVGFLALIAAPGPMWQRMAVLPEWARMKPIMLAARVSLPTAYGFLALAYGVNMWQGLAERILVTACMVWLACLAGYVVALSKRRRPQPPLPTGCK